MNVSTQPLLDRVAQLSWKRFQRYIGPQYGVFRRKAYSTPDASALNRFSKKLGEPFASEKLQAELPFPGSISRPGVVHETLLIEPPRYMPALWQSLEKGGVHCKVHSFAHMGEVYALPEPIVFMCTGVGSARLCADPNVYPIRGQLVLLKPQALDLPSCS